ncbi:hypothetical protein LZ32DRAFT_25150 [Colletotrichum eremochloae]|nr:hypothetical protein LZ32DRAFT_25150 [Colletotrichum eremochloae]
MFLRKEAFECELEGSTLPDPSYRGTFSCRKASESVHLRRVKSAVDVAWLMDLPPAAHDSYTLLVGQNKACLHLAGFWGVLNAAKRKGCEEMVVTETCRWSESESWDFHTEVLLIADHLVVSGELCDWSFDYVIVRVANNTTNLSYRVLSHISLST